MDTYIIPAEVSVKDAEFFRQKWQEYKSGELDFKGFEKIRVAFGIYEQRVRIRTSWRTLQALRQRIFASIYESQHSASFRKRRRIYRA